MSLIKIKRNYPLLFDRFFENDFMDWSNQNFSATNTTLPSVNIREGKEKFEVELAAPGLNKEDFKIELHHDLLTISSEKKVENEVKEGECYTCREFSYQSFSRSFSLPNIADGEKVVAKYDNGILTVMIPKKEEAKAKSSRLIEIM